MSMGNTQPEVRAVLDAISVKGPNPRYHDRQLAKTIREWPALAHALRGLAAAEGDRVALQALSKPGR